MALLRIPARQKNGTSTWIFDRDQRGQLPEGSLARLPREAGGLTGGKLSLLATAFTFSGGQELQSKQRSYSSSVLS